MATDTALHECLRGEKEEMRECIKELVSLGADVSLYNQDHESPVDLALKYNWDKEIIELMIWKGHGMDFDRQIPSLCSPLEIVVYRPRPWRTCGESSTVFGLENTDDSLANWDDSLAVFFVQIGASRQRLERLLWYELNRKEPANRLLSTLMDSFAYLPSLSQLEQSAHSCQCRPRFSYYQGLPLQDWVPPSVHRDTIQPFNHRIARHLYAAAQTSGFPGHMLLISAMIQAAPDTVPKSLVTQKKEDYQQRRSEVPTLAHLCRCSVRHTLKANVRQVLSLPIPTSHKEQILLGYPLRSEDQQNDQQKSVPFNNSS